MYIVFAQMYFLSFNITSRRNTFVCELRINVVLFLIACYVATESELETSSGQAGNLSWVDSGFVVERLKLLRGPEVRLEPQETTDFVRKR
jgi:hypothetical protein